MQLASAPLLGLAVEEHDLLGKQRLDVPAAVGDAGQLHELAEPDRVAADRELAHHARA
jgi:hypothetical protein